MLPLGDGRGIPLPRGLWRGLEGFGGASAPLQRRGHQTTRRDTSRDPRSESTDFKKTMLTVSFEDEQDWEWGPRTEPCGERTAPGVEPRPLVAS